MLFFAFFGPFIATYSAYSSARCEEELADSLCKASQVATTCEVFL